MTTEMQKDRARAGTTGAVSTRQFDRLEQRAKVAARAARNKQWRARKSGLQDRREVEPAEVRSLNHDTEARAQAEAAMQRFMTSSKGKPRRSR
jgi:predicted DNA-binding WGR domain protein